MRSYIADDFKFLPKTQQKEMEQWCEEIPVLGFNLGKYDLNLIKKVVKISSHIEG